MAFVEWYDCFNRVVWRPRDEGARRNYRALHTRRRTAWPAFAPGKSLCHLSLGVPTRHSNFDGIRLHRHSLWLVRHASTGLRVDNHDAGQRDAQTYAAECAERLVRGSGKKSDPCRQNHDRGRENRERA
jgi:hypothetical protein